MTATANDAAPARTLREGDVLHVGERIRTGSTGEAVLLTDDAGMIGVRPKAEFVTESFAAQGQATDHMALRPSKAASE
ncbi:MAG: hypothetical protein ACT4QA_23410 [Panacagrimonas sp.]